MQPPFASALHNVKHLTDLICISITLCKPIHTYLTVTSNLHIMRTESWVKWWQRNMPAQILLLLYIAIFGHCSISTSIRPTRYCHDKLLLSTHADRKECGMWIYWFTVCVCVFVCTVTDFSGEDKAIGVKFCMEVQRLPGQEISHFGELCSPDAQNRTNRSLA